MKKGKGGNFSSEFQCEGSYEKLGCMTNQRIQEETYHLLREVGDGDDSLEEEVGFWEKCLLVLCSLVSHGGIFLGGNGREE
ncbi:hypothetical protein L1049_001109 [Liquidambar formosana]|uniref:Uncharacterized protein n=1 Tax=Liquidambar formosana TaxID=63359 RepID=A0AAP0R5V6_LIQFO